MGAPDPWGAGDPAQHSTSASLIDCLLLKLYPASPRRPLLPPPQRQPRLLLPFVGADVAASVEAMARPHRPNTAAGSKKTPTLRPVPVVVVAVVVDPVVVVAVAVVDRTHRHWTWGERRDPGEG